MVGHEETSHDFALHYVAFHDFRHIGVRFDAVPDSFGINDDAGSEGAMVETSGFIRANHILEVEPLRFLLEPGMQRLGSEFRAAAARIVGASLVGTNENMSRECGQRTFPAAQACMMVV